MQRNLTRSAEMTPRKRVEISLRGGHSDRVPFTMYENKIPQCVAEREMRNRGMCIVKRDVPVLKTRFPNVKITQEIYWEGDRKFVRIWHETPVGKVSILYEDAGFTSWVHEKMFKSPDTDMTLAEARAAWPNKVLWLNFPSSVHLKADAEVEATTMDLLNQAGTMDGLIMGVTEDIPPHRWQNSCRAIMDGLDRHARENPKRYTSTHEQRHCW